MAIQISGTTVIDNSSNINAGIATFTRLDVPPIPITFSPTDSAANVAFASDIVITFNVPVTKGTGNITLRTRSASGTVLETIAVSAGTVTISGGVVTINPASDIPFLTDVFVVVDAGAFIGFTSTSVNALINTYNFTTVDLALGSSFEGGLLICKASTLRWVVSPLSAEVSRTWYLRENANTRAQVVSGCTGWFVPTSGQLQNPGYICRSFWGPSPCFSGSSYYWSSSEASPAPFAQLVCFGNGGIYMDTKPTTHCVRAFRCVVY